MSIERIYYCEGPDCERHVRTMRDDGGTFLVVNRRDEPEQHFCGWDCVLRYAGQREPETIVDWKPGDDIPGVDA